MNETVANRIAESFAAAGWAVEVHPATRYKSCWYLTIVKQGCVFDILESQTSRLNAHEVMRPPLASYMNPDTEMARTISEAMPVDEYDDGAFVKRVEKMLPRQLELRAVLAERQKKAERRK